MSTASSFLYGIVDTCTYNGVMRRSFSEEKMLGGQKSKHPFHLTNSLFPYCRPGLSETIRKGGW